MLWQEAAIRFIQKTVDIPFSAAYHSFVQTFALSELRTQCPASTSVVRSHHCLAKAGLGGDSEKEMNMGSDRIIDTEASVTEVVKAALGRTGNPRLKEILSAFVEHAHAFVRGANLTDQEFHA